MEKLRGPRPKPLAVSWNGVLNSGGSPVQDYLVSVKEVGSLREGNITVPAAGGGLSTSLQVLPLEGLWTAYSLYEDLHLTSYF